MNIKQLLLGILGFGCICIFLLWWFSSPSSNIHKDLSVDKDSWSDRISPLGKGEGIWEEALSPFRNENPSSYLELLDDLKSGKVNFVWEVWGLRGKCKPEYTPEACDATILAYIDSEYDSPDREKMKELFTSYFKYEEAYRNWEQPKELPFMELYEQIKKKRRDLLKDKAELIFGMEEAQVDFSEGAANFIQNSKNLSPADRVREFEAFKKKTYGPYYTALVGREDKYDHYQMEVNLREKEWENITSPKEKDEYLFKLETKYFGKDKAQALLNERIQQRSAKENISLYESKESEFLKNNSNLSEKEKEKKLKELRIQILGSEEEAEAYIRRKNIELAE